MPLPSWTRHTMLSLIDAQTNVIDTINEGPDTLDPLLFAGPTDRILLGLKAHANTISHARLVALEETFPLSRQEMGAVSFNRLSRAFVETADARASDSNHLGHKFAAFLHEHLAETAIVELAAIEWAWLESYHAADATALKVADLAGLDETALLGLPVRMSPSAQVVITSVPLASALGELADESPNAMLIVRPDAEVRLVPLDASQSALLGLAAQENCTLGNLMALALEQSGEQDPLEPILFLIGAGALVKTG
jgi:hypothetical protein